MTSGKIAKNKPPVVPDTGPTKDEGTIYIPSWEVYRDSDITVDKIQNFKRNVYGKGLERKQKNLIFSDNVKIQVFDSNGDTDEKLEMHLTQMFSTKDVNLQTMMTARFVDAFWWGPSVFNPVWKREGGELVLTKMVHLPTPSFRYLPAGREVYSNLLQGITIGPGHIIEVYQSSGFVTASRPLDNKNLYLILDSNDDQLVGDPVIAPIAPIIEMLSFSWNAEMGLVNRLGSPVFFIKISEPEPAHAGNGNMSDTDYANLVMANWDGNQAYPLRSNMEIITPSFDNTEVTTEVIAALQYVLIDYFSPSSFINQRDGGLIGNSGYSQERLMQSYLRGWHRQLESAFVPLFNTYFEANGYEGYKVNLEFPVMDIEDKTIRLEQAKIGCENKVLFINEVRERLDAEGISREEAVRMAEEWREFNETAGTDEDPEIGPFFKCASENTP